MKNMKKTIYAAVIAVLCVLPAQASDIVGWVEHARIHPHNIQIKAKLDTGAKTSSIHAAEIERFTKDDEKWVRFRFNTQYDDDEHERYDIVMEAPLVRNVKIVRHKQPMQRRPVVELEICIAGEKHKAQFSLIDRSRFLYPMLIGRRLLQNIGPVDAGRTFTKAPDCN